MRFEKPISLSYQAKTLISLSSIVRVERASTIEEWGSPLKSEETSGSSLTERIPFNAPSAAFRRASLIAEADAVLATAQTKSTQETFAVGTRIAIPSIFPLRSGRTSETALAAPVLVGIWERAAARARRRSSWATSRI